MNMTVPVQGNGVVQGTNWTKDANGRLMADPGVSGGAVSPAADVGVVDGGNNPPPPPPRPGYQKAPPKENLSAIEQFHPSLDPTKVQMTWDERTGRARITPIGEQNAAAAPVDTGLETEGVEGFPALGEQHDTIIEAVAPQLQQQTGGEVADLKNQLNQMSTLLTGLITAQLQGKSIAEVLGQPQAPDYNNIDLYDPATLGNFIKDEIGRATAPLQQAMVQSQRREDAAYVANQYGQQPNYQAKYQQAVNLMQNFQGMTLSQAMAAVTDIETALSPRQQRAAQHPGNAQPATTRTMTPAQANAKRDQAARLPANGGIRGASEAIPAHVTGLGQRIAWNALQASLGNLG